MVKPLIAFCFASIMLASHFEDGPDCPIQRLSASLMPADSTKPAPKPTYHPTAHDYEYTFYPMAKYQEYQRSHPIDSATMAIQTKIDTLASAMPVRVENRDGWITIRNLATMQTVYRQEVDFVGLTDDGAGSLVYSAKTQGKEVLAINPTYGWAIIIAKACTLKVKKGEDGCDYHIFYFGDIPNRTYAPK